MGPGLRRFARLACAATLPYAAACETSPSAYTEIVGLTFSAGELDLGFERSGGLEVENVGDRVLGPVDFSLTGTTDVFDQPVQGVGVTVDPQTISRLDPGASASLTVSVSVPEGFAPGLYRSEVQARAGFGATASAVLRYEVLDPAVEGVSEVVFVDPPESVRQGDVHELHLRATDADGQILNDPPATWWLRPTDGGLVGDGRFVGYAPGPVTVVARVGTVLDSVVVVVTTRGPVSSFSYLGGAAAGARLGADLWVHGGHAYTGTWRGPTTVGVPDGNAMFVWDISDPGHPVLTDSLVVDAQAASDVKIRADGTLGVLTQRGSSDGLNGVTLFTLDDPAHPAPLTRFTAGLEPGVTNVWLDGRYAYVSVGTPEGGLRVLDLGDPARPVLVASYYAGSSVLEDVYVRDGLAFLSHWDAGLVILDVGNGVAGGTPTSPVEVGRVLTKGGQTHNAWYWPEARVVFVGEEDFATPGVLHVVDVADLTRPVEVATFSVPGAPPHNFWLDEERGILYAAWYEQGVRAIDVSGTLWGELDRQGREVASALVGDGYRIWAPQLHEGLLFAADMNASLQVVRPLF